MKPAFGRKLASKSDSPKATIVPEKKSGTFNKRALDNSTEAKFLSSDANVVDKAYELVEPVLREKINPEEAAKQPRGDLVEVIENVISQIVTEKSIQINDLEKRDLTTVLLNELIDGGQSNEQAAEIAEEETEPSSGKQHPKNKTEQDQLASKESIIDAKDRLQPLLLEYIDAAAANEMDRTDLADQVSEAVNELMAQEKINLNLREQRLTIFFR